MKPKSTLITGFVLLLSVGFWPLKSQATPAEKEKITLLSAIERISQEYDVYFTFDMTLVSEVKVEYEYKEHDSVEDAVSEILRGTDLKYKFYDRRFVILYKKGEEGLESLKKMSEHLDGLIGEEEKMVKNTIPRRSGTILSPLPNRTISKAIKPISFSVEGTVTDEEGEPLIGVNIQVKGTNKGTSTDFDGKFILEDLDENSILIISYIGYQTQEISVSGLSVFNIIMESDTKLLEEVVVVGYGTQKREDLTGAISNLNSKDIRNLLVTRVDDAILGKVAGVQVKAVSGRPGAAPQIRIRGIGSISAGVDPLFVIDGLPMESIESLNPNDIENIDILKDASATAIYGSRGSNGVVLITTKRGREGKPIIELGISYGLQKVSHVPRMMNAMELAQYGLDGMRNKNLDNGADVSGDPQSWASPMPPIPMEVLSGSNRTDHQLVHDLLRVAPMKEYALGASGGSENFRYAVSGSFLDQDGIIKNSDFNRYSLRTNFDAKLSNRLNIKINLNPTFSSSNLIDESDNSSYGGWVSGSPINRAQLWGTYFPTFDENGDYYIFSQTDAAATWNPLAWIENVLNKENSSRLIGNIIGQYSITNNIFINVNIGGNIMSNRAMRFVPSLASLGGSGDGKANVATGRNSSFLDINWISEYTLHYERVFKNSHNFEAVGGFTAEKDKLQSSFLSSDRYPNNLVPTLSAVSGLFNDGSSDQIEWSLVSYLARVNYNFDKKYYLTGSIRADGSSRFGSNEKYGIFPSIALAWNIANEKWLVNNSNLNEFKFRVSYGETGNNDIGNYEQYATIDYKRYLLNNQTTTGFIPSGLSNSFLTWEKQSAFNIGLNSSLFDYKINISFDYFISRNKDLLLDIKIPSITGFSNRLKNIGLIENKGFEISVLTNNISNRSFEWNTNFNISSSKNKVLKLGPNDDPIFQAAGMVSGSNITMVGKPIGMFYGFLTDGVFMNQAEIEKGPLFGAGTSAASRPGDIRFVDVNGDGIIDNDDQSIMGNPYPDFYYGMTNNFSYKNLSLSVSFYGTYGGEILNMSGIGQLNQRGTRVGQQASQINYWKSETDPGDGVTPRPNDSPTGNNRAMSQRYLDSGTFLRISNINLSYLLLKNTTFFSNLNEFRIYFSTSNPFTFTKNTISFNPDVSNSNNPLTPGVDFNDYPLAKIFTLGLDVKF